MDDLDIADFGAGDAGNGKLIIFTSAKVRHARVSLIGDLDVTTARCLTEWAERIAAAPPRAIRLDASGLRFADACGMRALTQACWLLRRRCGAFEMTGLSAVGRRMAELTGAELPMIGAVATQGADSAGQADGRAAAVRARRVSRDRRADLAQTAEAVATTEQRPAATLDRMAEQRPG